MQKCSGKLFNRTFLDICCYRFVYSQRREMLLSLILLLYNDENYVNPFQFNVPFLYPLKTFGFQTFSGGTVMEDLARTC